MSLRGFLNRRIRNRTYGGVRGRGLNNPLLLDQMKLMPLGKEFESCTWRKLIN